MASGGKRPNSGRKPLNLGRSQRNIRMTDAEHKKVVEYLEQLRTTPMYYLGEERTNPVYESPKSGYCIFCNDHISTGSAQHNGKLLDVCIGCNALYDYKEEQ